MAGSQGTDETPTTTSTPAGSDAGKAEPPAASERAAPTLRSSGAYSRSSGTKAPKETLIKSLRCELLMNARYHASREAFLDTTHRILMFLIIILGATAVTDLFGYGVDWLKPLLAACSVIFAALDLTADLSNRARCHALMKRRYFELLADLTASRREIIEIEAQLHRCSADEEPAFHALLATCWNAAQEMVYGDSADFYNIKWRHYILKNICRFGRTTYEITKGPREVST